MAVCGILTHFCKHLIQARKTNPDLTWRNYWTNNIPQTILSVVGTIVLCVVAVETDSASAMMFFSCGVMGNSAADIIGDRANKFNAKP